MKARIGILQHPAIAVLLPVFLGVMPLRLAESYALPPKVREVRVTSQSLQALPRWEAQTVETLSTSPIPHGGVGFAPSGQLRILNPSAEFYSDHPLRGAWPASAPERLATGELRKKIFSHEGTSMHSAENPETRGPFRFQLGRVFYEPEASLPGPLWEVPLNFSPTGVEWSGRASSLRGWSSYPARLFYYVSGSADFSIWNWAEDSEPVRWLSCPRKEESWLVENLASGRNRFVRFESQGPRAYALFDLNVANSERSDIYAVLTRDCREFWVAGNFGLVRIVFSNKTLP